MWSCLQCEPPTQQQHNSNITTQGKNTDLFLMFWRRCSYSRQKCPPSLYNLYFDSFLLICTSFVVRTRGFLCVVYLLFRLANYKDPCHYADMSLVPKQLRQSDWEQSKLRISLPLQISKPLSCVFNKTVFLIKKKLTCRLVPRLFALARS